MLKKLSSRILLAAGLLFVAAGLGLRALAPQLAHGDASDFGIGALVGLGLALEVLALVKMRKQRRAS